MDMWKIHLQDVSNSLGTVYHLLKGEHSDEIDPSILISSGNAPDEALKGIGFAINSKRTKSLLETWAMHKEEKYLRSSQRNEPSSSSSSGMDSIGLDQENNFLSNEKTVRTGNSNMLLSSTRKRHSSPLSSGSMTDSDIPEMMNCSLGNTIKRPNLESSNNPSWFYNALRTESNIPVYGNMQMEIEPRQNNPPFAFFEIPPTPRFPDAQFFEQPRVEDPSLFHLNAFDSPPPSPEHRFEDYAFNMRPDPNGMIPDIIANIPDLNFNVHDNNNIANAHVCNLELCKSFHHMLRTTPENVQDKKHIIKEILQHAEQLMIQVIEHGPRELNEHMLEIHTSIFLVNNALIGSSTVESFMNGSETAQYLVVKLRAGINNYL